MKLRAIEHMGESPGKGKKLYRVKNITLDQSLFNWVGAPSDQGAIKHVIQLAGTQVRHIDLHAIP